MVLKDVMRAQAIQGLGGLTYFLLPQVTKLVVRWAFGMFSVFFWSKLGLSFQVFGVRGQGDTHFHSDSWSPSEDLLGGFCNFSL